jgi:hypothetical protein
MNSTHVMNRAADNIRILVCGQRLKKQFGTSRWCKGWRRLYPCAVLGISRIRSQNP